MRILLLSVLLAGVGLVSKGENTPSKNQTSPPASSSGMSQNETTVLSVRLLDNEEHIVYFCRFKNNEHLQQILAAASEQLDGSFTLELYKNSQANQVSEVLLRSTVEL